MLINVKIVKNTYKLNTNEFDVLFQQIKNGVITADNICKIKNSILI